MALTDLTGMRDGSIRLQMNSCSIGFLSLTLVQILNRTLIAQSHVRSSESTQHLEVMSYVVLTLKTLSALPWPDTMLKDLHSEILLRQQFIHEGETNWHRPHHLWVEKVTYGSSSLSEAYCLAAMYSKKQAHTWTERGKSIFHVSPKEENKITHLFCGLQIFRSEPAWKVRNCVVEGLLFLPHLRSSHANVLGGEQAAKNEYLSFIPCTWVVVNNLRSIFMDTYLLRDMMELTLCNFRVDEYMETTLAQLNEPIL
ncbi:MAG: hypothetical protein Q9166_007402 [cf. Caloplaca sp. 2 TL-2023]